MSSYQVKDHMPRRHLTLRGAYVYAPVADFGTSDVWDYLLQVPSPWGGNNRERVTLYRNASNEECPLVIDTSMPSYGSSRFGCWVCTVAQKDCSMEALVDNRQDGLEPLPDFRGWLAETEAPAKKHQYRDIRGRDGRVIFQKGGTLAARTDKRNGPRCQGENFRKNTALVAVVTEIARARNAALGQTALVWLRAQGDDVAPLPGTKRLKYLEENARSADVSLLPDDLTRLDALATRTAGPRYGESGMSVVER